MVARTLNGSVEGKAIGIDHNGVLLIETSDGSIKEIYSADIELK